MGKARKYCLPYISAEKRAVARRAFLACQTTEGDGVAGSRTWILDQVDAERSRWMQWLPADRYPKPRNSTSNDPCLRADGFHSSESLAQRC
jgi:hypothetical protein